MPYQNYPTERYETLKALYHAVADRYGEKPLFLQKDGDAMQSISYRRFSEDVDALGTALLARGLGGTRILIAGESSASWATAYLAVLCGVGVAVPIDKSLSPHAVEQIAQRTQASAIICSASVEQKLEGRLPALTRIGFSALPDLIDEGHLLIDASDRSYLDLSPDPDAVGVILFTSGSAGKEKGVMLSHRNLCFNLSEMCKMIAINETDLFLSVLPMHHAYECTCGFLCPLSRGATVAFSRGLRHLTQDMRTFSPTVMLCVPMLLETIYEKIQANVRKLGLEKQVRSTVKLTDAIAHEGLRSAAKKKAFSEIHASFGGRLRLLISGGASVSPETLKGLRELGFLAIQGYGLTECSPIVALNRDSFFRDTSVGMATPNTLLDIYDPQNNGAGEIRFQGENVMLGYFEDPIETARVLRDGWFYTGDLGYLDPDGFLYITGRKSNAITTANGRTVYPEELEALLDRTPFVKESMVVGLEGGRKKGLDIVAVILPDLDRMREVFGDGFTADQLDLEMRRALSDANCAVPDYKRIKSYLLRDLPFPKNSSQKLLRHGIAEEAQKQYRT